MNSNRLSLSTSPLTDPTAFETTRPPVLKADQDSVSIDNRSFLQLYQSTRQLAQDIQNESKKHFQKQLETLNQLDPNAFHITLAATAVTAGLISYLALTLLQSTNTTLPALRSNLNAPISFNVPSTINVPSQNFSHLTQMLETNVSKKIAQVTESFSAFGFNNFSNISSTNTSGSNPTSESLTNRSFASLPSSPKTPTIAILDQYNFSVTKNSSANLSPSPEKQALNPPMIMESIPFEEQVLSYIQKNNAGINPKVLDRIINISRELLAMNGFKSLSFFPETTQSLRYTAAAIREVAAIEDIDGQCHQLETALMTPNENDQTLKQLFTQFIAPSLWNLYDPYVAQTRQYLKGAQELCSNLRFDQ